MGVERTRKMCFSINFRNKGWIRTIWSWRSIFHIGSLLGPSRCRSFPPQCQWSRWWTSSSSPAGSEYFFIKVAMIQCRIGEIADLLSWFWYERWCCSCCGLSWWWLWSWWWRRRSLCWSPAPHSQSRESRWQRRRRRRWWPASRSPPS